MDGQGDLFDLLDAEPQTRALTPGEDEINAEREQPDSGLREEVRPEPVRADRGSGDVLRGDAGRTPAGAESESQRDSGRKLEADRGGPGKPARDGGQTASQLHGSGGAGMESDRSREVPGGSGRGRDAAGGRSGRRSGQLTPEPALTESQTTATPFRLTAGDRYAPSGAKSRFKANVRAVELARQLDAAERPATRAEQETLAAWSGWGAVPDVFDTSKEDWADEREELRQLLNEKEYAAARENILNAHYTDPALIETMWRTLTDLGLDRGTVLEPGSGSGNFIGAAPEGMQITGVELDPTTSSIARHLYPEADIRTESFAHTRVQPNTYDAAIGNVPFAQTRLLDETWNPGRRFSLHDHFIRKAIGGLHDGGVMAVVTSTSTSDRRNPALRAEVASEADLLGAVRLPNGAHRRTAGTDVATDVLVFRKRMPGEEPTQATLDWQTASDITIDDATRGKSASQRLNTYFQTRPENVLGTLGISSHWDTLAVTADSLEAVPEMLEQRLRSIVEEARADGRVYVPLSAVAEADRDARRAQETSLTPGTVVEHEGEFKEVSPDGYLEKIKTFKKHQPEIRALIDLRDKLTAVMRDQASSIADTDESAQLRDEAHAAWTAYVEKYGPVNRFETYWATVTVENEETGEKEKVREPRRKQPPAVKALQSDPNFGLLIAAEKFNEEAQEASPADILTQRTVSVERPLLGADTAEEALGLAINATGRADLEQIAVRLGTDLDTAREELGTLVFDDPANPDTIITRAEYLSGHVRSKLAEAREAARRDPDGPWKVNVEALEAVMPRDVPVEDIEATIGAVWIPPEDHQQFLRELTRDARAEVVRPGAGFWEVKSGPAKRKTIEASSEWGTELRPAYDLFRSMLRKSTIEVRREHIDSDGTKRNVLDIEATEAAREKAEAIAERFSEWVWEDSERADRLYRAYNEAFNSYVARDYSVEAERLDLPGLVADFVPHDHQRTAVARMVAEPAVGLFHQVGAGKTAAMVMGLTELKRRGLITKPAVLVPGHMLEQFTREWKQLYPNAKILSADSSTLAIKKEDVSQRRAFVAKAAMSDWDGIIMTHNAFEKIDVRNSTRERYTDAVVSALEETLSRAREIEGVRRTRTQKMIQTAISGAKARLEESLSNKDLNGLTFEDMGVDYLGIDEAHLFKNLATVSNIPGAGIKGSGRANDLDMKLAYLRDTFGERVVTMATGTPIANSITEAHVMMRYLRPDILEATSVEHFDDWANTFGEVVTRFERNAAGKMKQKERFAKFKNVPEMLGGWQQFADVKMTEDLSYLKTPDLKVDENGERKARYEIIPESSTHAMYKRKLEKRLNNLVGTRARKGEDNHLTVYGDGRKAALDPRLVGEFTDEPVKLDKVAENVAQIWAENRENRYTIYEGTDELSERPGGLQIVFCDISTPNPEKWNAYDELKTTLVEQYGMDPERIRFIHEAEDAEKKAALFKEAREGGLDVLIGSSERMGTGANIQRRAVALHHVDCPWRPAELTQREGRILRQGNQNAEVDIIRYATENSFDSTSWDIIARKATAVQQIMRGRIDVREMEDPGDMALDAQQLMAAASGNPLLLEKVELETAVNKLERRSRGHDRQQSVLRGRAKDAEKTIAYVDNELPRVRKLAEKSVETKGDKFSATVFGRLVDDRTDATDLLRRVLETNVPHIREQPYVPPVLQHNALQVGGQTFTLEMEGAPRNQAKLSLVMEGTRAPGTAVTVALTDVLKKDSPPNLALLAENRVSALPSVADRLEERRAEAVKDLDSASGLIGAPFKGAEELADLKKQLQDITDKINGTRSGKPDPSVGRQNASSAGETSSSSVRNEQAEQSPVRRLMMQNRTTGFKQQTMQPRRGTPVTSQPDMVPKNGRER